MGLVPDRSGLMRNLPAWEELGRNSQYLSSLDLVEWAVVGLGHAQGYFVGSGSSRDRVVHQIGYPPYCHWVFALDA